MLRIRGREVKIDYINELEPYIDELYRANIRGNKLQSCSPFRYEKNPSFAINLDNGLWVDSGAEDESTRKGNFISLLAYFRKESYEETSEYLLEKYAHILDDVSSIKLSLSLELPNVVAIRKDTYANVINKPSDYLKGRGILDGVQNVFNTGVGTKGDCITLPWHDKNGRIINVKYRSTTNKAFWYSKDGEPVKNHIYGLFLIKQYRMTTVWLVESEIDCLYLWSLGIPAVALGGASISESQCRLLRSSGIETIIIATDNDTVGHRFADVLVKEFLSYMNVFRFIFPEGKKDVNELLPYEIIGGKIEERKPLFL